MRSTLKCGIISLLNGGVCFMKTKIVYISGNEVFDMADIRAAFEEVRMALNLDKETVLFGVPVDADDAGLTANEPEATAQIDTVVADLEPEIEEIPEEEISEEIVSPIQDEVIAEPVVEEQPKKRARKAKKEIVETESEATAEQEKTEEKIVPIMSILSVKSEEEVAEPMVEQAPEIITQEIEIVHEISEPEQITETTEEEIPEETVEDIDEQEITDEDGEEEVDLEKLLSEMTPLHEDIIEEEKLPEPTPEPEYNDDISVDATLEQLATEFAETQDKIATEKTSSRSKIGKLRNILPFKQSKHKDQGIGDLFGWAGNAANDEDFSVPGFFTNVASKK